MMRQSLRSTISKGWPYTSPKNEERLSMKIRADSIYRQYAQAHDPKKLFDKAEQWMLTMRDAKYDASQQELIDKELHETMVRAIFGSNMIEQAGLGWDITRQLCRKVLNGQEVRDIDERESCENFLVEIFCEHSDLKDTPAKYTLRGRNEVVQHARAFQHIINAFVVENQDLSEDLIKETHRILTKGVPILSTDHPDVAPEAYGGIYRTVIVGAGSTNFTVPRFVPAKMKELCENLKEELAAAEERKSIDPFSIAAKYSLQFVEIHPFQDGNGRMCRMILNAIICRYVGIIVPIGERGEEISEYLDIKKRASRDMEGHGEYATFVLQRAVTRLREMKKKIAGKKQP